MMTILDELKQLQQKLIKITKELKLRAIRGQDITFDDIKKLEELVK